jgi:hypothetical protein
MGRFFLTIGVGLVLALVGNIITQKIRPTKANAPPFDRLADRVIFLMSAGGVVVVCVLVAMLFSR